MRKELINILKIDKFWYKTKWIHSIRVKLTAIYIAISIVSIILISSIMYKTLRNTYMDERTKELKRQANITAVHIEKNKYLYNVNFPQFTTDLLQTSLESNARIVVCNLNSKVINDSSNKSTGKIMTKEEVVGALSGKDVININNEEVTLGVPIKSENDKIIGVIYIEDQSTTLRNIISLVSAQIIIIGTIVLVLVSIIVYIVTGFISSPINGMLKIIEKMADGKFDERIKVNGHDELAELSIAFNQMSARLQKTDANRQEFVSNVSHELKTPLSSMKVLIESLLLQEDAPKEMYKEFLSDTNSEIDRLTDIINHLLTLVKLDVKALPMAYESININQMIDGIIKRLMPLATRKNLQINFEEEKEEIIAEIDKINITLAISNIIENAIKYTDEGHIDVKLDADHQNMYITVQDTGIGMSEEDQTKVFDRFYRIDKTRDRQTGGTGLGLSITHRAIILHGGSIKLTSAEGEGSTFLIRLPLKKVAK